ncbi:MAG: sigma factor [Gemmatimonadales bacterium]
MPDEKQLVARLLAVARRLLRNEEDARDCVQDAFLQAFRNIEQFEERASLGGWLPHNDVSHGFV